MTTCTCVVKNREEGESQREWMKGWMCMFHWMQTDYYVNKTVSEISGEAVEKIARQFEAQDDYGKLRLHLADTNTDTK